VRWLVVLAFLVWCWLLTMRGRFWSAGPVLPVAVPTRAPPVAIVVPARDEAPFIARTVRSLLDQRYSGPFSVTLVDDNSEDGTGAIVRGLDGSGRREGVKLTVLTGAARPAGWAGKLWAVHQGIAAALETPPHAPRTDSPETESPRTDSPETESPKADSPTTGTPEADTPEYVFLTDADIAHDPPHLASLVALAERHDLDMVSEMVTLSCESWAEKALIPAFVFYFQLLYPFAWVNNPLCGTAAAAGGTVLIRRRALIRIGGIEAVRGALIDDVALAGAVKAGGRIYLGHSALARSIRPYPGMSDIWRMIARSAYAQLRFSPLLVAGTTLAMALIWLVPPLAALFGHGWSRGLGLLTWAAFAAAYLPTLTRFGRSPVWALFLPAIALFYMAATIGSAVNHHLGRGVVWKGRAYAGGSP
jgi:glycosyltransferase involved in cell wall biosynthesis